MRYCSFTAPVLFLFFLFTLKVSATPDSTLGTPLVIRLMNGINGVMTPLPNTDKAELTLYFKYGSVYENDSVAGLANVLKNILSQRIQSALKSGKLALTSANCTFVSHATPEQTYYRFVCNEALLKNCLSFIRDSIFKAKFSQQEIDSALAQVREEIKRNELIPRKQLETKILKEVFRQDYQKLMPLGNPAKFQYINLSSLERNFEKYYVGNNAILTVTGKFSTPTFSANFYAELNTLPYAEFDPETITKIVDFRPMIYNNTFIVEDTVEYPEFHIYWQFPGTYAYQQGSYFAHLFNAIMNDGNNYLRAIAAKMNCRKFETRYEPGSFSGTFNIVLQPDKNRLIETYERIMYEMGRLNNTLMNESMVNAGKLLFKKQYEEEKLTPLFTEKMVKAWPYKEESYMLTLLDSVLDVNEKEMRRFTGEYLIENAHVSALLISKADRKVLNIDSLFTDADEQVGKYVFTYRNNITDLEGADNLIKLRNLAQWLKRNPDVVVRINGFADRNEYNKTYSDTIIRFMDSMPTFRKVMPDIFKKGYLRPEMMRAMKIIKSLYDYGISADRLSGTSMAASSANKSEEEANRKCTVNLTKMRKVIPLKEYHYGITTK